MWSISKKSNWSKWMPTVTNGGNTCQIRVDIDTGKVECAPDCWIENVPVSEYEKLCRLNEVNNIEEVEVN